MKPKHKDLKENIQYSRVGSTKGAENPDIRHYSIEVEDYMSTVIAGSWNKSWKQLKEILV